MEPISDLETLLAGMQPHLDDGRYVFVTVPAGVELDPQRIVASIREKEGLSVILPEETAQQLGLSAGFVAAWITLTVYSDLEAVGLTAAVSTALAQAGISCNVVAGTQHDHLFVPFDRAREAMAVLHALSRARG